VLQVRINCLSKILSLTIRAEQSSHRHNGHSHSSRKDARKQERTERKKRKADHFSKTQTTHSAGERKTEQEYVESPQRKRVKISRDSVSRPPATKSHHEPTTTKVSSRRRTEEPRNTESVSKQKLGTTALERLVNKSAAKARSLKDVPSKGPRSREEEEEDAYIAYLESKLGYSGGGSRRKDDDMDGLGGSCAR
jgi:nucleolar MIF4G domain-containing protein 1